MRYSTEPKYRKYVKGYGFLSFARKFGELLQQVKQKLKKKKIKQIKDKKSTYHQKKDSKLLMT